MMPGDRDRGDKLDTADAVLHEAALVEAEQSKTTPEQRAVARTVSGSVQERLAELRRGLVPAADAPVKARPIRATLLTLGRDALLDMIESITRAMGGAVSYAHRDLEGLSDDDLRRLVEMLQPES